MPDRANLSLDQRESGAWRTFNSGRWGSAIDVRDFIVRNVVPYEGDDKFLVGPSVRTKAVWHRRPFRSRRQSVGDEAREDPCRPR